MFPGQVFTGKVVSRASAGGGGTLRATGLTVESVDTDDNPFLVSIELDDSELQPPPGATCTVAIYTRDSGASSLFRKIILRMENWTNYIITN